MSRIGWTDEEDYPGQFGLWQANCQRSLDGRKGQAALRELETALLALPQKRLITSELVNDAGEVCAIGAVAKHRGQLTEDMRARGECHMEEVGVDLGMPRLVAWKIVELNDILLSDREGRLVIHAGPYRWPSEQPTSWEFTMTPEQRYERVLEWVRGELKGDLTCSSN